MVTTRSAIGQRSDLRECPKGGRLQNIRFRRKSRLTSLSAFGDEHHRREPLVLGGYRTFRPKSFQFAMLVIANSPTSGFALATLELAVIPENCRNQNRVHQGNSRNEPAQILRPSIILDHSTPCMEAKPDHDKKQPRHHRSSRSIRQFHWLFSNSGTTLISLFSRSM